MILPGMETQMTHKPLYNLYVSCFSTEGGICHVILNDDGTLEEKEWVRLPLPTYHILDDQKLYVLLRNPFEDGKIGALTVIPVNDDATLSTNGPLYKTEGESTCHLCRKNGITYIANYTTGNVVMIKDGEDKLSKIVQHEGHGPIVLREDGYRQNGPHTHYVTLTPDQKYILNTDLGLDAIFIYDLELNEVGIAHVPEGHGARHLAFSADGKLLYCANELGNTVTVFRYADGTLTQLDSYLTIPEDYKELTTIAAIRVVDGYVYVSNRGHDSIAVFKIVGEKLERVQIQKCNGMRPRDFDFFGNFVICTNETTDDLTVLKVENHLLSIVDSKLSVPHPLCVNGTPIL